MFFSESGCIYHSVSVMQDQRLSDTSSTYIELVFVICCRLIVMVCVYCVT